MQDHFLPRFGLRNLIVLLTYKTYHLTDILRIGHLLRLGKAKKPDLAHFHIFGSRVWAHIPSEKRKSLDPHSTPFIFVGFPDDVKGYRLIDPSTDLLIIEHTVQFEESPLHASLLQHVYNLVLTSVIDIRDDDSACSNATYSDTDSEDSVHANEKLVQPNEETMLELQRMSMWEQSTLQATGKLAGDPLDFRRTRSQHVDPSHVLSTSK
jgi:hypothetical protein